jgi:geranylgeranyl reductase family protein
MEYDVIIVGAGPAGSTTARELAKRGLSLVMIDKAEFPRDKPCGGAVSVRCAGLLDVDLTPVIESTITDVFITLKQRRGKGTELLRSSPKAFAYMTQRTRLDALLAEKAVESGAVFRQCESIRSVERRGGHVTVRTSRNAYRGRVLVAADGANGITARMSGLSHPRDYQYGIAMEGNVTPAKGFPAKWKKAIGLDFGGIPGGYSWLFPKGNHLNIGIGGYEYIGPRLRSQLKSLVEFYDFDPAGLWGVRGHRLPQRRGNFALADGNVMLVGDAAGILDPLTAEGIFAAVHSAQIAAVNIFQYLNGQTVSLEGYTQELEQHILSDIDVARRLHDVFYLWPGAFVAFERITPILWSAMVDLFRGDATYVSISRGLGPVWPMVKLGSRLKRLSHE